MKTTDALRANFRRTARPLPLALSLALAASCIEASGASHSALAVSRAMTLATATSTLATQAVTNCADSGTGSLRSAIASAADGATVDMSQLQCSTITLASGSLAVTQNNLTVKGPGRGALSIQPDASKAIPVFTHSGNGLLTISQVSVRNGINTNANGGCITSSAGSVRVADALIGYCLTQQTSGDFRGGGGIYAHGDVLIDDSVILANIANDSVEHVTGGGAFAAGNLTVRRSAILGNSATSSLRSSTAGALGGGLSAKRNVDIFASAIFYNSAGSSSRRGYGAGVFALDFYNDSTLVMTNSTVSHNYSGWFTGGVTSSAPTHISNCTIAFNTAKETDGLVKVGVGLFVYSGATTLESTIIAKNTRYYNHLNYKVDFTLYKASVTGSHNLITSNYASPPGTLTSDPQLSALNDNGGSGLTLTHALGASSPAIGAGSNPLNLPSDERGPGFSRVFEGFVDIGAFQTGDAIFANGLDPPS